MANQKPNDQGAPPTKVHVGPATKKNNWLIWLILGLALLASLFGLSRCDRDKGVVSTAPATAVAGTSGIAAYLSSNDPLPKTFAFDQVNFDTAKSEVHAASRDELKSLAATLKKHPNARLRIVGYADSRGDASANAALSKARADSVKAALVADGIDAGRLETAAGGDTNPVDTNATKTGQAENRRAEVIVLQR